MENVFLINEKVIFIPDACSLTPQKDWPNGRVTLHAPAAECLQLLLANNGQPVTQKTFFTLVWEKKGAVVSTNTLYQSIASVRKALRATGLDEEIIRTLPRQGFQCNASVRTATLAEFMPLMPEPHLQQEAEGVPDTGEKKPDDVSVGRGLFISGLLSLTIVALFGLWKNSQERTTSFSWFPAGRSENCALHSSWSGAEYSQSMFNEVRQRYSIDCRKKQSAYLTINRLQTGSTLLLCNAPIEQNGVQCRSIMFQDESHEEK